LEIVLKLGKGLARVGKEKVTNYADFIV